MANSAIKYARFFATGLLITAVVLLVINPKAEENLPSGFNTPIIAFEFIQNKQEIIKFFQVKDRTGYISKMLLGNAIDYLFMFIYSAFLFCLAVFIRQKTGAKSMYAAMFFCILMLLGDALENYQIYQLVTKYKENIDLVNSVASYNYFDIHIILLKFFTWVKWISIAITFALFSGFFIKLKSSFSKITGFFAFLSFALAILAFFKHGFFNEIFTNSVVIVFLLLTIFTFLYKEEKLQFKY